MKRHLIIYIGMFLFAVSTFAQRRELCKLSPSVRRMVIEKNMLGRQHKVKLQSGKERLLCAFVETRGEVEDLFNDNHVEILATFGDIRIVSFPEENILSLASDARVNRIEAGRGTSVLNNNVVQQINVNPVYAGQNLPQAYTGKGVVMGIQDIGFDLTNPNFYSADMTDYRIRAFWDMLSEDTEGSELFVGQEYRGKEQLLAYAHSRDGLKQSHGSHTLGTAAGSGYGSPYRGMAYESDICIVSNAVSDDLEFIPEEDQEKFTYAADALGFKYIFDYAESVGKPCVISFSEGSSQDLYGDDLLYYKVLELLTGPGRIIVSSAGNNSLSLNYVNKPVGKESAGTFLETWSGKLYYMAAGEKGYSTRLVFYGEKNDTLSISTDWLCQQTDSLHYDTLEIANRKYCIIEGAYPSCYDENILVTEIYVEGPDHMGGSGNFISAEVVGLEQEVEMYKLIGSFKTSSMNSLLCDAQSAKNINSPSSAPALISVGATAYLTGYTNQNGTYREINQGTNGERAHFSSVGPTLDGRIKPDVMAPGVNIVSSSNSFFFEANPGNSQERDIVEKYEFGDRTYYWKADMGTSMSSPAVGGAIALWLQARPTLTKDEILDVFAHTCKQYDPSLEYPNNLYGYGEIDVYRGLLYILGLDGIEAISAEQPQTVGFKVTGRHEVEVSFACPQKKAGQVRVYSTSGQLLGVTQVAEGQDRVAVQVPEGASGVVAIQVNGDSKESTGSTLIRL